VSITRLQQARQMYALGKLVERVGFRGGGMDMGNESNQAQSAASTGGGSNNNNNNNNDNNYNYKGPADLGVTTRTVNKVTAPEAYEIIGGKKFDVTPDTRDERERARVKQAILNPTVKKNKIFDPISNMFINPFAPKQKKEFGLLDIGLMLATGGLFGAKAKTAAQLFGTAKRANNLVNTLSNTFGFENPIANMFSKNNKSTSKSKSTKKNNITTNNGGGGDGEGIASLDNQASGYDEYILLLQKLQSGNISDSERNRYNVLKNMLGI